jgi:hypothetical protein
MHNSSKVPSRRKNASLQRRTFGNWRELKKKITEELHHLEDPKLRINNQQWIELKKNITQVLHHLEHPPHSGTKLFFMVYVIP